MYNLDPKEKQHGRVYIHGVCVCGCVCDHSRVDGACMRNARGWHFLGWSHVLGKFAGSVNIVNGSGIYRIKATPKYRSLIGVCIYESYIYICTLDSGESENGARCAGRRSLDSISFRTIFSENFYFSIIIFNIVGY